MCPITPTRAIPIVPTMAISNVHVKLKHGGHEDIVDKPNVEDVVIEDGNWMV